MFKYIWHKIAGLKVANYRLRSVLVAERKKSKEHLLSEIILHYHVLEKGLSMPERRYGFGCRNVIELCSLIKQYLVRYNKDSNQLLFAVEAILEYKQIHISSGKDYPLDVQSAIESTVILFPEAKPVSQPEMSKSDFFQFSNSSFLDFSHGRHSCRHLKGSVSSDTVIKAIELAQEISPSACNRQSIKIKLIEEKKMVSSILALQSGNRGFGHAFDKLVIITTDMSYWNYVTNIGGFVDGGIYLMNLLYSLYYYKVGACTLNSYFRPKEDTTVRKILHLPETEMFVAIVGIGDICDHVVLARSGRKNVNEILKIY